MSHGIKSRERNRIDTMIAAGASNAAIAAATGRRANTIQRIKRAARLVPVEKDSGIDSRYVLSTKEIQSSAGGIS